MKSYPATSRREEAGVDPVAEEEVAAAEVVAAVRQALLQDLQDHQAHRLDQEEVLAAAVVPEGMTTTLSKTLWYCL